MISTYLRPRRAVAWMAAAALAASGLSLGLAAPAQAAAVTVTVTDTFGNGVDAWLDVLQEDPGDPGTYEPYDEFFVPGTGQIELPDGNYKIEICDDNDVLRTEWYDNQLDFDAATVVTVAGSPLVTQPDRARPPTRDHRRREAGRRSGRRRVRRGAHARTPSTPPTRWAASPSRSTRAPTRSCSATSRSGSPASTGRTSTTQSDATPVVVGGANVDLGSVNVGPGVNVSGTVTGPDRRTAARHRRHGLPGGRALRVGGGPDRHGRRVLRRRAAAGHLQGGLRGPERRVLRASSGTTPPCWPRRRRW